MDPVIHFLDHLIAAARGKPSSSPVGRRGSADRCADLRRQDEDDRADHRARFSARTEARGPADACRAPGWRRAHHRAGPRTASCLTTSRPRPSRCCITHRDRRHSRSGRQGPALAQDCGRTGLAAGRPVAPSQRRPRQGPSRLLSHRPDLLRKLPSRSGPGAMDRPRPLHDRHQVRQGRAPQVDPQPQRRDRLQLPLARPGSDGRPGDHRPARGGDRRIGWWSRRPTASGSPSGRRDIEDRKTSDVSLMPEGLAQTMSDQQLVDLLAILSTLRKPVSIVGQYHVIGPLTEPGGVPADRRRCQDRPGRGRARAAAAELLPGAGSTPMPRDWPTSRRWSPADAERGLRLHAGHLAGRAAGQAGDRGPAPT